MNDEDINDFLPSILNPRGVRKQHGNFTLTQNSVVSRCSLSLKKRNGFASVKRALHESFPTGKENEQNNNILKTGNTSFNHVAKNLPTLGKSLNRSPAEISRVFSPIKDTTLTSLNQPTPNSKIGRTLTAIDEISLGFSAVDDINTERRNIGTSPFSFGELEPVQIEVTAGETNEANITHSSATELDEDNEPKDSSSTVIYQVIQQPVLTVSFGIVNCESLDISTKNGNIKKVNIFRKDDAMDVDCQIIECSDISVEGHSEDEDACLGGPTPAKKPAVAVNLEIKKTNSTENATENSKVLILNTDAIERLSHVIVQPPNYKLVKRQIFDNNKFKNYGKRKHGFVRNGNSVLGDSLKQKRIDCYLVRGGGVSKVRVDNAEDEVGCEDMSKNSGVADGVKCERSGRGKGSRREGGSPRRAVRGPESPRTSAGAGAGAGVKTTASEQRGPLRARNDSVSSAPSPRKNADAVQFALPTKTSANKNVVHPKNIPYYKIVAGTHFAVDAFSYGDIPNVKHYFLTHFHSDHYSGLKKSFNKMLFCSQITAELCQTRLGVNPKCIRVLNFDETITVEGVEVTAVDANHCPGALMLVFTLPNGKTLLHTGDFRASPYMESYPVFWNKDIHTIYLDSTYCNPRYDFPTQEQSLEMALYHLRQKKLALEKAGKKFSSVLIVCGTYTIGKEKFFLGMARRVGCSVWACPEKDRVLQAVEGRSFCGTAPAACQLHVVPMRDLTHEKLHSYLDSLAGAFSEVVAFKPSGWENGKNSTVEKDNVTIHGIPYSEHSSFSEMIRFVKFLNPKQVVPTVDISGGVKAVQKYFPCPLLCKEDTQSQSKMTDYFSIQHRQQNSAVT